MGESTKLPRIEFPRRHYIRFLTGFATDSNFKPTDENDRPLIIELVNGGYISGCATHPTTGVLKYINPQITVTGRLFLQQLEKEERDASVWGWIRTHPLEIFTLILAVATVALALGTFWLVRETRSGIAHQIQVTSWLDMEKRFDSPEMKKARKGLATELDTYDPKRTTALDETVMDVFEDMGSLYSRNLIDRDLTARSFGYFASYWWRACKPYVEDQRKNSGDKTYFDDFENLATALKGNDPQITAADLKKFLEDERSLVVYDLPAEPPAKLPAITTAK